jgi:curved DNA-binding protein
VAYKDYYSVLGISRSATQDEVNQGYRKLARKYHPDVSKEPDAEKRFKEVGEAYEVLKDAEKRKLYDQYGDAWKAASEGRGPTSGPGAERVRTDFSGFRDTDFDPEQFNDIGSLFEAFFGRGAGQAGAPRGAQQRVWRQGGADREATMELSVEDAYRGGERSLALMDAETGEQKRYTVNIPGGVRSGQRIRLSGQGSHGFGGGPPGDLYLQVQLRGNDRFRLEGDDVYTTLPVAPWEAGLGATVPLNTLDGSVRVKVPPGSSSGRKIRLRGKGYGTADGARGDLYAELRVDVPTELSAEERELLQRWSEKSRFDPRAEEVP